VTATIPATTDVVVTRGARVRKFALDQGIYGILIILVVVATILYPAFLTPDSILLVLAQNAPLGITAVGMTIVLIGGGFDLSVGAIFALAGVLSAQIAQTGNVGLGILVGVIAGAVCGLGNGLIVTLLRVNPFVATLGTMTLISGATLLYTNSKPFVVSDPGFAFIGAGYLSIFPVSVIVMVLIFAIAAFVLRKTVYGRVLYATGGNREASRLSGLRTTAIVASTYVISGLLAGLAGVVSASQLGTGQANAGSTLALNAIAVVVIGGTALTGGEGSVLRSGVGLAILAVLQNIYYTLAIDTYWQLIPQGAIVIGAVALDERLRKRVLQ
jgi:ribose transport system permease protein